MPTIHIEQVVNDYDAWKRVFDDDPLDRRGSGVRRYRVARATDEPNRVLIDLEFDDAATANAMLGRLRQLWAGSAAAMLASVQGTIVDEVESVDL